jgi:hypothetical protein
MEKRKVFINTAGYSEQDQQQMVDAIRAYEEGKEQPQGRFKIIGTLPKEGQEGA